MTSVVDLTKALAMLVKTGKVTYGFKETLEMLKSGKAKMIIFAGNCPAEKREQLERLAKLSQTPILQYQGSSVDLGLTCGKPFTVSVLAVREVGDSKILKLVER
ncbi:50S ribosomal protein L30e [Candidatus Hecatella orcuttiae]|uniref:50S ribosomal protein L30e n=1 Tax=Candidatus Hecatella orcuttiae TaxID=1935119 RepID=UPI00286823C8|nr:50S ribosomal protein L30e [Candidatus Hecatella orcuttiae]